MTLNGRSTAENRTISAFYGSKCKRKIVAFQWSDEIGHGTAELENAKVAQLVSDWKIVPLRTRTSLERLFHRQFLLLIVKATRFTTFAASLGAVQAVLGRIYTTGKPGGTGMVAMVKFVTWPIVAIQRHGSGGFCTIDSERSAQLVTLCRSYHTALDICTCAWRPLVLLCMKATHHWFLLSVKTGIISGIPVVGFHFLFCFGDFYTFYSTFPFFPWRCLPNCSQ